MSAGHSDLSNIIPKEILADVELEKSDPSYTSMVTKELMKLKSKEEAEKVHLQEEERWEARRKAQELWAKKKEKELRAKLEAEKKHAEQVRLAKLKHEKEIEAEKQKQHRYDLYKQKLKEDLRKQIEKEKEALEKQEVEMKYKAELTTQLREEYGINKIVQAPVHTAVNSPIPPAPSNFDLSTIKTEPITAKDLANPSKKSVPIKREMEPIYSITSPKKRVASAAEFRDLMTPKKSKTNLNNKFCSPKPTSCSKDREDPTFEISNQDYLHSITNVKVEKMKTAHDFLHLKPTKDFTLKFGMACRGPTVWLTKSHWKLLVTLNWIHFSAS